MNMNKINRLRKVKLFLIYNENSGNKVTHSISNISCIRNKECDF